MDMSEENRMKLELAAGLMEKFNDSFLLSFLTGLLTIGACAVLNIVTMYLTRKITGTNYLLRNYLNRAEKARSPAVKSRLR